MLAIRLQRRGRKGHAQFRVILQDSHRSPSSGKVTAYLGSVDPHTKTAQLNGEKIEFYLKNGAQPSNRAAKLFKKEGIQLPEWVTITDTKSGAVRNPEKHGSDETPSSDGSDTAVSDETAKSNTDESQPQESEKEDAPKAEAENQEASSDTAPAPEQADDTDSKSDDKTDG